MNAFHTIETPRSAMGAIAMIRVVHPEPSALGLIDPATGQVRLAKFFDIDEGVIVRWDADSIMLMPHGGVAIVRALSNALTERGVPIGETIDPVASYPEAENEIEAWMLSALSRAPSPLAVDALLGQPKRWRALGVDRVVDAARVSEIADSMVLARLIEPPIVAAVGRANVGKSTLINALVGERVAIVADIAGTTRDHVGVLVDLGGLVVRWIDTPGIDERIGEGIGQADEIEIALRVVAQADVIVHCIDSANDPGVLDARLDSVIAAQTPRVRVGMRSDLASLRGDVDLAIGLDGSGQGDGQGDGPSDGLAGLAGLAGVVERVRETLVPQRILDDARPWRFWDAIGGEPSRPSLRIL